MRGTRPRALVDQPHDDGSQIPEHPTYQDENHAGRRPEGSRRDDPRDAKAVSVAKKCFSNAGPDTAAGTVHSAP